MTAVLMLAVASCSATDATGGEDGTGVTPEPGSALSGFDLDEIPMDVQLGLRRDGVGLEAAALTANTPGSTTYGTWLSPAEISTRFGTPTASRDDVLAFLADAGLDASADATGSVITIHGSASQVGDLFEIGWTVLTDGAGTPLVTPVDPVTVPDAIRDDVIEVVGLTQSLPADPTSAGATSGGAGAPLSVPDDPGACGPAKAGWSAIVERYGPPPPSASAHGSGAPTRYAITSVQVPDDAPIAVWAACLGTAAPAVDVVELEPGRSAVGGLEAELDVETLMAAVPSLDRVTALQVDPYDWVGTPFVAALGTLDVVSTSVGYCEAGLTKGDVTLAEWVLAALALSGTTVVAASGDHGSTCAADRSAPSVQYPASSAWVTAVGGLAVVSGAEQAWFDPTDGQASGGGTSTFVDGDGDGGRIVPDVAGPASPRSLPQLPVCDRRTCGWRHVGGTSVAAPLVAALLGATGASVTGRGGRAPAFWNALLAAEAPGGLVVRDIADGSNDLAGVGCCIGAVGQDPVTGRGPIDPSSLEVAALHHSP